MKLLALDTATELCSAALWIDGACLARECLRARGSGEIILGMVAELLAEGQIDLAALDAIAFGRGPGAFTGVRLAVAVAQGLSFATGLPLLPISDLRALAQQALSQPDAPARALVCQDARMEQVYWACFERADAGPGPAGAGSALARVARAVSAEAVSAPGQVVVPAAWSGETVCGAGSGFEAYPVLTGLSGITLRPVSGHLRPRAPEIAMLAALEDLSCAVTAAQAQPVYLRDEVAALPAGN